MVGFALSRGCELKKSLLGTFQRDPVCRSALSELPGLTADKRLGRLIRRRAIPKTLLVPQGRLPEPGHRQRIKMLLVLMLQGRTMRRYLSPDARGQ